MAVADIGRPMEIALGLWLLAVMLIVGLKLLIHRDRMNGLLSERIGPGGQTLADRVQLMAMIVFGAAWYLSDVARAVAAADGPLTVMPEVNETLLTLLAGSQTVYLAGKTARSVRP